MHITIELNTWASSLYRSILAHKPIQTVRCLLVNRNPLLQCTITRRPRSMQIAARGDRISILVGLWVLVHRRSSPPYGGLLISF